MKYLRNKAAGKQDDRTMEMEELDLLTYVMSAAQSIMGYGGFLENHV